MGRTASLIILSALLTVGIAGPLAMTHGLSHGSDCFLAAVADMPCLSPGTVGGHLSALQRVFAAVPAASVLAVLFAAFISALAWLGLLPHGPSHTTLALLSRKYPREASLSRLPALRWHARLNHSPTSA